MLTKLEVKELYERKAEMKYKVGDVVKVIDGGGIYRVTDVVIVDESGDGYRYEVGTGLYYRKEDLELLFSKANMFEVGQVVWVLYSSGNIFSMRVERVLVNYAKNVVQYLLSWKTDSGEIHYDWHTVKNDVFCSLVEAREAWELSRNTQEFQATRGNK